MSKTSRFIKDSVTTMTEIVLPNDANPLGFLRGGKLLDWMDIASEITAQKHTKHVALTVAIDNVTFKNPIKVGDIVTIQAQVTHAFNSSLEILVEVWAENIPAGKAYKTNEAHFTFVAINEKGEPVAVPEAVPISSIEQANYEAAKKRRTKRTLNKNNSN